VEESAGAVDVYKGKGLERSQPNRAYSCPHCGVKLSPAQYPDDPPKPQPRRTEEVPL